jgi:ABC-2 type transport system ATP-binding protein
VSVCGLTPVPQRTTLARQIGVVVGQRSQLWDLPLRESFALLRHIYRVPPDEHAARLRRAAPPTSAQGCFITRTAQVPGSKAS